MSSFVQDLKYNFKQGDVLTRIIYINVIVFFALQLVKIIGFFSQQHQLEVSIIEWIALPSNIYSFIVKPWTLLTHFFVHNDFFHVLFNLIWLYSGGKIFIEYLGTKRLLATYILGGIIGGLFLLISYSLLPVFQNTNTLGMGASAAVLAVFIAVATYVPNLEIQLPLIGNVKIKYVAIFFIILDFISIPSFNSGGHIAHLGGALYGYLYIISYKKGVDWSNYFYAVVDKISAIFKTKSSIKVVYKNTTTKVSNDFDYKSNKVERQKLVDSILDKISKSGYESLSKAEKEILFNESSRS